MSSGKWEQEGTSIEGAADGKWGHQVNVVVDKCAWRCVKCQHIENVERCSRCECGPWFTGGYHNGELALVCAACRLPKEPWVCPQCGTRNPVRFAFGKMKSGPCFVATAAFEGANAPEVIFLRTFRDSVLSHTLVGRSFISFYNVASPPLAEIVSRSERLKRLARKMLRKVVSELKRIS